jgi:hypothetical protein
MRHFMGFISYINSDIKHLLHYNVLHGHEHSLVLLRAAYEIGTVHKNCLYEQAFGCCYIMQRAAIKPL